jgi:hypothetical protein
MTLTRINARMDRDKMSGLQSPEEGRRSWRPGFLDVLNPLSAGVAS